MNGPTETGNYQRLRETTRSRHEAIEKLPFFESLTGHVLPRQSAVSYLRGMAVIHATVETSLRRAAGSTFGPWQQDCARLDDLQSTLANADVAGLPDISRAVDAAIDLADRILLDAGDPVALLGHLYVLEGSQLGGQLLRRHFATALGLDVDQVQYFTSDRRQLQKRWSRFRRQLDAFELDEPDLECMLGAARACFDGIAQLARGCFPYEDSELGRRITAINPEAGRHAIPQTEKEITRALRCARIAWQRFPYLDARYGERGRRFTLSDSCWLVSLYDLDEPFVIKSLFWLRRVLSNRGLPTVILKTHLEVIDRDIADEDSGRAGRSTGFRATVSRFRAERDAILQPQARRALTEKYETSFAQCPGLNVPGAAEVLIAAAIDTALGIESARDQALSWMRDRPGSSEPWIKVLDRLMEELAVHGL